MDSDAFLYKELWDVLEFEIQINYLTCISKQVGLLFMIQCGN